MEENSQSSQAFSKDLVLSNLATPQDLLEHPSSKGFGEKCSRSDRDISVGKGVGAPLLGYLPSLKHSMYPSGTAEGH